MAQHVGAGELGLVGPLGQRLGRSSQVDVVDGDPLPPRLHERPGLGGQGPDAGRIQLEVVEEHRPADVGELVGADDRRRRRVGFEAQGGAGATGGQLRHPHVEAGVGQLAAEVGHQLPGLVVAEDDLAPAQAGRSGQRRQHPLEAGELGLDLAPLVDRSGDEGPIQQGRATIDAVDQHLQHPRVALVGRVELHDELHTGRVGDGLGPPIEAVGQLDADPLRREERRAVEA